MPRRPPRSPRFASLGNLFREARRASPQRQNNGACASDGAGLPWLSRKLRPEDCFGKPDGPAPSAEITERARATARVCHGCRRPRSPRFASLGNLFREARSGQPPAPKRRKRARGRLSQKLWPSPGKLFREARRASPQRQNNGARACDGAGLPWLSRKLRPEDCFGKPDGPAPSAEITERARATARVCHGCRRPRSPRFASLGNLFREARSGQPPAPKRRKRARGRLSQKLWPSPGKLFREARRASPQRQNNGARACDGAGLPWLSRKLRPSPGKLFREAQRASSQRHYGSERAEASAVAQKVFLGSPTGTSFRAARRARPKPKPSTILRIAKNGTRRARAGFLRTLNPKRF